MESKKTLFLATVTLLFITNSYLYAYYDIIDLGGGWSYAYSINDKGQVVGRAYFGGRLRACLFDNTGGGANIDLGVVSYHQYSRATSINNNGQIVGFTMRNPEFGDLPPMTSRACLFDPTGGGGRKNFGSPPARE